MLHGYLASWLTVHILGEDQIMARQMDRIRQGMSPQAAFEQEIDTRDNSVSALLDALYKLYHVLSVQNRELASSNQLLEEKVEARTHDLATLNQQLRHEQEDLKRALAHVEATQQQLLNAEKMASLGRMVAGFAHELNTPVGIAIGAVSNAERVLRETEAMLGGDEVSEDALLAKFSVLREGNELALSNLQRSATLVQRLKRSSIDQDAMAQRCFSLRELIEDVVLGLKTRLQEASVRVDIDCPESILIDGVPGLYEQLLIALIGNAIRHAFVPGDSGGAIQLAVTLDAAQRLKIVCRDNGRGMSEDVARHVFEPFFTTQRSSGRLGLGLYMCYNLVTSKLGGSITCSSQPGAGSVFEVLAPITRVEATS
jgi:C4-dicarboxylate-specific signal transduction histidine kinase